MSRTLMLTGRLFKADLSSECTADADPRHIRDARAWNQATDRHCAIAAFDAALDQQPEGN